MAGYSGDLPPDAFNLARYCLAGAAERTPGKPALIVATQAHDPAGDTVLTYGDLQDRVLRIAHGLAELGLAPGSRLFIRMHNTPEYAMVFLAATAIGLVPIPASSALTDREIEFILRDCAPAAIAVSGDMSVPVSANALIQIGAGEIGNFLGQDARADYAATNKDDPAFLIYTSGTSGRPKGVLHAHRAVWGRRPMYQGWYGISADDVMVHTGAFNWTYTLGVGMFDPWANGATTVLYTGARDIHVWPALVSRFKASIIASVPTLYRQMLKYCDTLKEPLSCLRHGLTAGEPMPVALAEEWQETTGIALYEALGMSEISTYISSAPAVPTKPGSPGKPQPGRAVAILPIEGGVEPLPAGETGLIAVHRSDPGLMLGYWNHPGTGDNEDGDGVYRGDWFSGGDLGAMDEDGYIWFEGRNDDVMNAMGVRVSPEEVERVLRQHDSVGEVAVTEIHVRADVSVIAAFIVAAGETRNETELADFAAARLASYKCPRQFYFIDQLPLTANGKIKRKALQALVRP